MASVVLHGFGGDGALTDLSPFVTKLHAYLRLAGVEYAFRPGDMRAAPRGKLPYIDHDGAIIGDSERIIEHLRERGIADLDRDLDPAQRADRTAIASMCELELYFILACFRWREPRGWASYGPKIQAALRRVGIPRPATGVVLRIVRRGNLKQHEAQGVSRRPPEENLARAGQLFDAFEDFVGRHPGPWWFGEQPSSLDAIAWAFIDGTISKEVDTPLHGLLDGRTQLETWFEHADAKIRAAGS